MINFTVENRVGSVVIARAAAGNAFTSHMVDELSDVLAAAAATTDILILKGEGADFTIGRDRGELRSGSAFDAFRSISELNKSIAGYPGILVAAVRGRSFGLGVSLALRADLAIAADDAQFAVDEVAFGVPPMFVMEALLDHVPPKRALDIVLNSRVFPACEALEIGILSQTVKPDHFERAVDDLVKVLQMRNREVVLICKRYLRAARKLPHDGRPAFALAKQTEFALGSGRRILKTSLETKAET